MFNPLHLRYPAKIVEVDQEEEEVLIHFEGWNQRFDEWLSMSSEKLRPATRHSDRKDGSKKFKPKVMFMNKTMISRYKHCKSWFHCLKEKKLNFIIHLTVQNLT